MSWVETSIKVRYQETDQMGVVYHANYFVWFEVARTEMIKTIGYHYKKLEEKGLLLPVVDVSCQYLVSAKYDDELLVKVKLSKYTGLRIEFDYEVIRAEDQTLLARGNTKHVWIDKQHKPVRLKNIDINLHHQLLKLEAK